MPDEVGLETFKQPDVSVVIICYNDANNLPSAITSVLKQTLQNLEVIIVDDRSTDSSFDVANSFAESDSRIKTNQLDINSGGCGAPRNKGISLASGRYIMFLDSDDTLERHACKNLLLAAEKTGAEVTSGAVERVLIGSDGQSHRWYGNLYLHRQFLSDISEMPEFINDTLVTNKLFKADLLRKHSMSFQETLHYEDIIFSAEALVRAEGIAIIPETVYYWNVFPSEQRISITNQRSDFKNVKDRLKAIEIADSWFRKASSSEVLYEFETKALNHHLMLYLSDLVSRPDSWAEELYELVIDYLSEIDNYVFQMLPINMQATYHAFLLKDFKSTRRQIIAQRNGGLSGNIITSESNNHYWIESSNSKPAAPQNSTFFDNKLPIPEEYVDTPFRNQTLVHLIEQYQTKGNKVSIRGESLDPLGLLKTELQEFKLILKTSSGSFTYSTDITIVDKTNDSVKWVASIPKPKRGRVQEQEERFIRVRVLLNTGADNTSPAKFFSLNNYPVKIRTFSNSLLGDSWIISPGELEIATIKIHTSNRGRITKRLITRLVNISPKLNRFVFDENARQSIIRKYLFGIFQILPIKKKTALFESHMGSSAFDNPRAVYEEMRATKPNFRYIWIHDGSDEVVNELSNLHVTLVKRNSLKYVFYLATTKYLVDNQSFPGFFTRRTSQQYLQTWHGIPLKKMGYDTIHPKNVSEIKRLQHLTEQWTHLNIPNKYFEKTFVKAFKYEAAQIKYGSPRNDNLLDLANKSKEIRQRLGLPEGKNIVMYAPTFRESNDSKKEVGPLLDIAKWSKSLGEDTILIIRAHYLNTFDISDELSSTIYDFSDYGNIADLYAISDALITDYSSVMFDYALLEKPIFIFAPDYEKYLESRGTYFNLKENSPGPVVLSTDSLVAIFRNEFKNHEYKNQLREFRKRYSDREVGISSKKSVQALLGIETNE